MNLNCDPVTVTITTPPSKGTVVDNGGGSFTYTAIVNKVGNDTIVFNVTDGLGATSTGTISLSLMNTAPAFVGDSSYGFSLSDPLSSSLGIAGELQASDSDGDVIQYSIQSKSFMSINSTTGELTVFDVQQLELAVDAASPGTLELQVTVTDSLGLCGALGYIRIAGVLAGGPRIYLETQSGTIYYPTSGVDLLNKLNDIKNAGDKLSKVMAT